MRKHGGRARRRQSQVEREIGISKSRFYMMHAMTNAPKDNRPAITLETLERARLKVLVHDRSLLDAMAKYEYKPRGIYGIGRIEPDADLRP